jgi:uncharacterized protein YhdP
LTEKVHRWLGRTIWRLLLIAIVCMAVYVSGGRILLSNLSPLQSDIQRALQQTTGLSVTFERIQGDMVAFTPLVEIHQLTLSDDRSGFELSVQSARVSIHPWSSLIALEPRFEELSLDGPVVRANSNLGADGSSGLDMAGLFTGFSRLSVSDGMLIVPIRDAQDVGRDVVLRGEGTLSRRGSERIFDAWLFSDQGWSTRVTGQGIGNPLDLSSFEGEFYGIWHSPTAAALGPLGDHQFSLEGTVEFWGQVQSATPSLTLVADLPEIALVNQDGAPQSLSLQATSVMAQTETGWLGFIEGAQVGIEGDIVALPRAQLQFADRHLAVVAEPLDLGVLSDWAMNTRQLPESVHNIIAGLSPRGQVDGLAVTVEFTDDLSIGALPWRIAMNLSDGGTTPFRGAPGFSGIDAYLEIQPASAKAWLETQQVSLDLPQIYEAPLRIESLQGELSGRWNDATLWLSDGLFAAKTPQHDAYIQLGMEIPLVRDGRVPTMSLAIGAPEAPISIYQSYVPRVIGDQTYQWLQRAFLAGQLAETSFLWRGALRGFATAEQTVQVGAAIQQASLNVDRNWPQITSIDAALYLDESRVSVWAESARSADVSITPASVELDTRVFNSLINMQLSAQGRTEDALSWLRMTPILGEQAKRLDGLSATGSVTATLSLVDDLSQFGKNPDIVVNTAFRDTTLADANLQLALEHLNGQVQYSNARGFNSQNLAGTLWGSPVDIAIGTSDAAGEASFASHIRTRISADHVADWLAPEVPIPVAGAADVTIDVQWGTVSQAVLRSSLQGISVMLPDTLGKESETSTEMRLTIPFAHDAPWTFYWADHAAGSMVWHGNELSGMALDLTPRSHDPGTLNLPSVDGLYVTGQVPAIDLEAWLVAGESLRQSGLSVGRNTQLTLEGVSIESLQLGGADLGSLNLDFTPYPDWDMLGLNAVWLDAELTLPHTDEFQTTLVVNTLDLDQMPEILPQDTGTSVPDLGGPLDIIVANLVYRGDVIGAASFELDSDGQRLLASDIDGNLARVYFEEGTQLVWSASDDSVTSELQLNATLADASETLSFLDLPRLVQTESGQITAQLSWPGSPLDASASNLSGLIDLKVKNGAFLPDSDQATGALRVISLLNLAGLLGQANVNQLFEPGVSFKTAKGPLQFDAGSLTIDSFSIDGGSGSFTFDSNIDLLNDRIDGELIVTLPLVDNIPWVAALAGGLPIAAGAFLLSKVFEDQVNQLASGVYSVAGELNNPEVTFVRVFDANPSATRQVVEKVSQPGAAENSPTTN